jgi:hypothetical protein
MIVKLDKIVKAFRRELTANPMKAGVLGVLLLGGMYFWGPLVWKWVANRGVPAATSAAGNPSQTQEHASGQSDSGQPVPRQAEIKETPIAWQEIRKRRETDPLARSADYRPQWNQIFQVAAVSPVSKPSDEVESKKQEELNPRDLGMVLQGVLIGSKSKKAIISGKVYCEHDLITIGQSTDPTSNNDRQPDIEFRLVKVFRKMVEVERAGRTWRLTLATAEPANMKQDKIDRAALPQDMLPDEKKTSSDQN